MLQSLFQNSNITKISDLQSKFQANVNNLDVWAIHKIPLSNRTDTQLRVQFTYSFKHMGYFEDKRGPIGAEQYIRNCMSSAVAHWKNSCLH